MGHLLKTEELDKKVAPIINELSEIYSEDNIDIFYMGPDTQNITDMGEFKSCSFGFHHISIAADGNIYKCCGTAAPNFKHARLGKIPESLEEFRKIIKINQSLSFNPKSCIKTGARCTRAAMKINKEYSESQKKANLVF